MTPALPASGALAAVADCLGLRLIVRVGSRAVGADPPPEDESDLELAVLATPGRRVSQHDVAVLSDLHGSADLRTMERAWSRRKLNPLLDAAP